MPPPGGFGNSTRARGAGRGATGSPLVQHVPMRLSPPGTMARRHGAVDLPAGLLDIPLAHGVLAVLRGSATRCGIGSERRRHYRLNDRVALRAADGG